MATRIERPLTAFSLSGGPKKRPREIADDHRKWIATLPCLVCGSERDVQAAHLRYSSLIHGKRETGLAEKSSDSRTVPLCERHHLTGPDAQHGMSERKFWVQHNIDPIVVAALLWAATGDSEAGYAIVTAARVSFVFRHPERVQP